ncbi:MAG: hypothetical protein ACYDH9_07105 [Limisphaerales bacterium]
MRRTFLLHPPAPRLALLLLVGFTARASGADFTVKVVDKEPPKELSAPIREKLQSKAVQLLDGDKPVYEFWFDAEIPLKSKPDSAGKALEAIKETTLLGAVAVPGTQRDFKDNEIAAGVYTMRFGLQPQDGDHLGTADFPSFAVLIKAALDTDLDGLSTFKKMTKASGKDTATSHPIVLSLRPADSDQGDFPKLNEPAPDQKGVLLKVPVQVAGGDAKTSIVFDLVCRGHGKTQ